MQTIDEKDFETYLAREEGQHIAYASQYADEVKKRLRGDVEFQGDTLPWSKTHKCFRLRRGEVTLWGGYSGHGKSLLLGQICAWNLRKTKWLIASMEMSPASTMERMAKQMAGNGKPSEKFVDRMMSWTDGRLWIYDQTDSVRSDRILGMIHYAAAMGVDHIIIDSLIKCGIGREDYEKQAAFVDRLCWAAKNKNIHVHLVHHMRKGDNEKKRPGKHDFRGAGEITDLVDNVVIVYRNMEKAEREQSGNPVMVGDPDCWLSIVKQRHFEWEGMFKLWVVPETMQFVSAFDRGVMDFPTT